MKLKESLKAKDIAKLLGCYFKGDPNQIVTGLNEIHFVEEGDIVYVDHPKYYDKALQSKATIILIDKEVEAPDGKVLLISNTPFDDYNKLAKHFSPEKRITEASNQTAKIDETAHISPNVTIGDNVQIGANVVIQPGVVIMNNVTIEDDVIIGANSVIGHDAFYYKKKNNSYERMHSCGGVIIEKRVEIGASCTIDTGVSALTIIGEGSKLDNQVHVGHDTIIGKNCLIAAQVGLAGCVTIEDNVTLWGQVGCASNVTLGENAVIFAQSGISKSLAPNKTYFGSPAKDIRLMYREMAALRKLPEILESL
jgi:UDP-3-O-[3-hydroxymyristoyl] glucosamine N-acyltransferase